jgi:hypothetical protein
MRRTRNAVERATTRRRKEDIRGSVWMLIPYGAAPARRSPARAALSARSHPWDQLRAEYVRDLGAIDAGLVGAADALVGRRARR